MIQRLPEGLFQAVFFMFLLLNTSAKKCNSHTVGQFIEISIKKILTIKNAGVIIYAYFYK